MREPIEITVYGLRVILDEVQGHMAVHGDGLSWDTLQRVKDEVWGPHARAIEVYPRACEVVNNAPCRHLWRLGETDFAPDLLGRETHMPNLISEDQLETRWRDAWREAGG